MKTKQESRTRIFTVPVKMIGAFFTYTEGCQLKTKLIDAEPPHNIVVDITYTEEEKEDVMTLIEITEGYFNRRDF
jgi:hypothetical protein